MGAHVVYGNDREIAVEHDQGGVTVHAVFRPDAKGAPEMVSLSMTGAVTWETIREVRTQPLWAALQQAEPFSLAVAGVTRPEDRGQHHRPGRPAADATYALWALRYLQHCGRGSRHPVRDLAEEHGVSLAAVSAYLRRARERGLLLGNGHGRQGGHLSARAHELLGD